MNSTTITRGKGTALIVAVVATLALLLSSCASEDAVAAPQHGGSHAAAAPKAAESQFHDAMRVLWEQHVAWTRMAIVDFAADSPGFEATAARLMQNQVDIGDAIKPFYGDAAGSSLTALLKDHIAIAVDIMKAAKSGDSAAFDAAKVRWYANSDDIADFLAKANPKYWPQDAMRAMMKMHLDQTLAEASNQLTGKFADSAKNYDEIESHILTMADGLSAGIIGAFPKKFK